MLCWCQCSPSGNKRMKNTVVCQGNGNSGLCFHFVWVFVVSLPSHQPTRAVGSWWRLADSPRVCQWLTCYPAVPLNSGHATQVRVTHPAVVHAPRQITQGQKHSLTGWIIVLVMIFVDPSNPSWEQLWCGGIISTFQKRVPSKCIHHCAN